MGAVRIKSTIQIPLLKQQTESHCGPAVLQMLYAFLHKKYTQDQIAVAGRVKKKIKENGMRPSQMAKAVQTLTPTLRFWFKQHDTIDDLDTVVNKYHWPVAINWQGLFYDNPEDERNNPHDDDGHYSVVIGINRKKDTITLADPYKEYAQQPRIFSLSWFEQRWWDTVEDTDKKTKQILVTATRHFMLVITPKKEVFPQKLGFLSPEELGMLIQPTLWIRVINWVRSVGTKA